MGENVPYPRLLQVLTDLVDNKSSGTLFIHSDCNHAITFALDAGRIFAIFHGARRGRKAIPLISRISGGSYRFESAGLSGINHELPSTPEILNLLRTPHGNGQTRPAGTSLDAPDAKLSDDEKDRLCQQLKGLLAKHIGPIAEMVFEDAREEIGDFCASPELAKDFIEKLSLDIDDAGELAQFKTDAYTAINNMLKAE